MRIALASLFIAAVALGNAACSTDPPKVERSLAAKQAALVTVQFYDGDQPKGSCAGVLVGPQAVLTAGHCASNRTRAVVTAPNAGGRRAESHRAWWFDWTNEASPRKSPQLHDVAILSLDTPIALKRYPDIADDAVAPGAKTLHVRRVKGKGKTKIAFEATPGRAQPQKSGRSHYYKLDGTNGSLDSGGPVFDARTGKIVGVVSTRGGKSKALYVAKTKSLTKWLRQQLLALLENPPKPPAPSSSAEKQPKPPAPGQPPPATPPKTTPPSNQTGGGSPSGGGSSGGKMGKQAGKSTKAAGKKPSSSSSGGSQQPKAGEQEPKEPGACEGGDMECDPDRLCGAAEGTSSESDNCDTQCEDGDESCEDPQCSESESCECQDEEQCGGDEDDPFEDPEYGRDDEDDDGPDTEGDDWGDEGLDDASEDVADDDYYPDSEGDGDYEGGSDDYSESGYDDGSGYDDSGDYGDDYGGGDYGGDDYGGDYGGDDYSGEE